MSLFANYLTLKIYIEKLMLNGGGSYTVNSTHPGPERDVCLKCGGLEFLAQSPLPPPPRA